MGLIKALTSSASNVIGDQFKEFVTCPTTDKSVLVTRGIVNHGEANTNFTEGVISNGSTIVVPKGYAMMIIENGAIKEFSAEEGEFTWDTSSEPSVFEGGFFNGIGESIKRIGSRITYGGQAAKDQRVYYINLLNITGNKFGSQQPVTVADPVYGSVEITYNGEYSFKVVDPAVLVAELIGANAKDTITVDEVVGGQLKTQFGSNVSTAISNLMVQNNISFNQVQGYKNDVVAVMNDLLDESWRKQYGLEIQDVALNVNASEESREIVREMDKAVMTQTRMNKANSDNAQGAVLTAMNTAAANENGAMNGFIGANMTGAFGANVMGAVTADAEPANTINNTPTAQPGETTLAQDVPVKETTGAKFCSQCGAPASGKFCSQCGAELQ